MLKIKLDSWVDLPKLSSRSFRSLIEAGVVYESGRGFFIKHNINLRPTKFIFHKELKDEVCFIFNCITCNKETDCNMCEYKFNCSVEDVGGSCMCENCMETKSLQDYWEKVVV